MPHVDDGTLHALLDGALRSDDPEAAAAVEVHLSGCEDCRARLESAAEVRERAFGILAHAAPIAPAAAPDFEEVRGRARSGGVRRHAPAVHRHARWTRGIAWAASLVLALGTGYLLRDLVDLPSADRVEAPAASPTPASEAAEPSSGRPSPRDRQDAVAGSAEQEASTPSPGEPAEGAGSRRDPGAEEEVEADAAIDVQTQPMGNRAEAFVESREAPSLPSVRASGSVAGAQWSAATLAEARAAIEGPVYRLPRAEITEIYIESTDQSDVRPRILTMQRLETGIPLQVVQRWGESAAQPGEAAARQADAADPGALPQPEVARTTRGAYVLEVTGSLPEELLEILAESAMPAV